MVRRWQGWFPALAVTLATVGLAILDLTDTSLRRWSQGRDFATSVVAGVLVLLVTTLVVDRVVRVRQLKARSYAIAAQSAIIMSQAARAAKAMSAASRWGCRPGRRVGRTPNLPDDAADRRPGSHRRRNIEELPRTRSEAGRRARAHAADDRSAGRGIGDFESRARRGGRPASRRIDPAAQDSQPRRTGSRHRRWVARVHFRPQASPRAGASLPPGWCPSCTASLPAAVAGRQHRTRRPTAPRPVNSAPCSEAPHRGRPAAYRLKNRATASASPRAIACCPARDSATDASGGSVRNSGSISAAGAIVGVSR